MQINSITPEEARVGDLVTIEGTGLGSLAGNCSVTFNGVYANPESWESEAIKVRVPNGATSGPVAVAFGGKAVEYYYHIVPSLRDEPVEDIIRAENQQGKAGADPSSDKAKRETLPSPKQVEERTPISEDKRRVVDPTANEDPKKPVESDEEGTPSELNRKEVDEPKKSVVGDTAHPNPNAPKK
jgi:IPT/TIG domain